MSIGRASWPCWLAPRSRLRIAAEPGTVARSSAPRQAGPAGTSPAAAATLPDDRSPASTRTAPTGAAATPAGSSGTTGTEPRRLGRATTTGRRATTQPTAAPRPAPARVQEPDRHHRRDDHASPTSPTSPARCPASSSRRQQATQAYAAYFNATEDICGRKLSSSSTSRRRRRRPAGLREGLLTTSSRAVGSMSAFDSGGAATAAGLRPARPALDAVTPSATTAPPASAPSPSTPGWCRARCRVLPRSKYQDAAAARGAALHQRRGGPGNAGAFKTALGARPAGSSTTSRASTSPSSTTRPTSSR